MKLYKEIENIKHQIKKLTDEHIPKIEQKALDDASSFASDNKPEPVGDRIGVYLNPIRSSVLRVLTEIKQILNPDGHKYAGAQIDRIANEKKAWINKKINEVDAKIRPKEADLRRERPDYSWDWLPWLIAGVFIIDGIDAIWIGISFQIFGENLLISVALGFLWAAVFYGLSHLIPWLIRFGRTIRERTSIIAGITVLLGILFYILGGIRIVNLIGLGGEGIQEAVKHLAPWTFMFLNIILLGVSTGIVARYFPTKADKLQYERWKKLRNELNTLYVERRELESTIVKIDKEAEIERAYHAEFIFIWETTITNMEARYIEIADSFINENILKRGDLESPDCFDQPLPPLIT